MTSFRSGDLSDILFWIEETRDLSMNSCQITFWRSSLAFHIHCPSCISFPEPSGMTSRVRYAFDCYRSWASPPNNTLKASHREMVDGGVLQADVIRTCVLSCNWGHFILASVAFFVSIEGSELQLVYSVSVGHHSDATLHSVHNESLARNLYRCA